MKNKFKMDIKSIFVHLNHLHAGPLPSGVKGGTILGAPTAQGAHKIQELYYIGHVLLNNF